MTSHPAEVLLLDGTLGAWRSQVLKMLAVDAFPS